MNYFQFFIEKYINLAFGWTFILTELVACFSVSFVFNSVDFRKWKDVLRLGIDFFLTWIVQCFGLSCFFTFIFEVAGVSQAGQYTRFFLWPLLAYLHALVNFDKTKIRQLVTCATASSTLIMMTISFSGSLGTLISDIVGTPNSLLQDWTLYIVMALLVGLIVLLKVYSPFKYKHVKVAPVVLINIVFALSVVSLITTSILISDGAVISAIVALLMVIDVVVYGIFFILVKNYNETLEYQARAIKAEGENDQIRIFNLQYEELHKLRHELKNKVAILERLYEQKEFDQMQNYFSDLYENVHGVIDPIDCGNPLVSSTVNMEKAKAKTNNIEIKSHISVKRELNIESQDFSSLLTNALDNAIEAQIRCGFRDDIDLSIFQEGDYLFITVQNRADPYDDGLPLLQSRKNDRENHGYGVKIIRSICKKYNGTCSFRQDEEQFVFRAMVQVQEEL